jgi:polyhydroxyalkanoate synthesis regulator phasin
MVMREQLQWLVGCGRGWAAERAEFALNITEQFEQGAISESEYQELMRDLINSDKLNECADDQDIKNLLVSCIMIGAKLA